MDYKYEERWTADSIEEIECKESIGKIFKLSNVSYFCDESFETIYFPGKTYIATAELYLWHYLYDNIAQFEYLKTQIPDLKMQMLSPVGFDGGPVEEFLKESRKMDFGVMHSEPIDPPPHKYFEDTFKVFVDQKNITNINKSNLKFEEVYLAFDSGKYFVNIFKQHQDKFWFGVYHAYWTDKFFEQTSYKNRDLFNETWWRDIGIISMRNKLIKEIDKNKINTPKKIFISRKDSDKRYNSNKKSNRYVENQIGDSVEEYFVSQGYESISFEGMAYFEQLQYFRNATHIAGVVGSGFCQTIVCKPETFVTTIFLNKKYFFSYQFISRLIPYKLIELDLRRVGDDFEKIKVYLKKHIGYLKNIEDLNNAKNN